MSDTGKVVLLVRPRGVGPSWWSRYSTEPATKLVIRNGRPEFETIGHTFEYAWNTVTETGGFTDGIDPSSAVEGDVALGERVEAWFEAHEDDPWPWELRALILAD